MCIYILGIAKKPKVTRSKDRNFDKAIPEIMFSVPNLIATHPIFYNGLDMQSCMHMCFSVNCKLMSCSYKCSTGCSISCDGHVPFQQFKFI